MELKDRKYTTKAGLECLAEVVEFIEDKLQTDIQPLESKSFACQYDMAARQGEYLYSHTCFWRIENGELCLVVGEYEDKEIAYNSKVVRIEWINRIDFCKAVEALEDIINEYNRLCEEKDKEIERFLSLFTGIKKK